jgi:hypothetical protein
MPQAAGDANHFLAKTQRKIELNACGLTLPFPTSKRHSRV